MNQIEIQSLRVLQCSRPPGALSLSDPLYPFGPPFNFWQVSHCWYVSMSSAVRQGCHAPKYRLTTNTKLLMISSLTDDWLQRLLSEIILYLIIILMMNCHNENQISCGHQYCHVYIFWIKSTLTDWGSWSRWTSIQDDIHAMSPRTPLAHTTRIHTLPLERRKKFCTKGWNAAHPSFELSPFKCCTWSFWKCT